MVRVAVAVAMVVGLLVGGGDAKVPGNRLLVVDRLATKGTSRLLFELSGPEVVQDSPDLMAGISPEVASCADYEDDVGHLTEAACPGVGLAIGQYYGDQE